MLTDRRPLVTASAVLMMTVGVLGACASKGAPDSATPAGSPHAQEAFADVARVLRHPRCLNCHTVTDYPRVGDDRRRHAMNVLRGPDGLGTPAMRCGNCHQPENQTLIGVPGAPHWKIAPLSMGWEGLDDHALAESLKNPANTGGRGLDEVLHHMAEDPLVGWAWEPGPDRAAPPMSRDDFVRAFEVWVESGAPTPPRGITSTF